MKKNFLRRCGAMAVAIILSLSCLSLPAFASSGGDDTGDLAQRAGSVPTAPTYDIWQVFTGEIDQDFLETTGETQLMGLCYGANAKSSADFMGRDEVPTITPGQPLTGDDLNVAQAMYYIMSVDGLTDSDGAFLLTNLFVDRNSTPFKSGLTLEQVNATTVPAGWYVITSCTMGTTGSEGTVAKCFGNYEITTGGRAIGSFMTSDGTLNYVPKAGNVSLEKDIVRIYRGGISASSMEVENNVFGVNSMKRAFVAVGDGIRFRLTATLPENIASYRGFMLDFVDFLPYGFLLNPASITVRFPDVSDKPVPVLEDNTLFPEAGLKVGFAAAEFKLPASENRAYYEDGLEVTVSRVVGSTRLNAEYYNIWPDMIDEVMQLIAAESWSNDGVEPIVDGGSARVSASGEDIADIIANIASSVPSLGRTCVVEYTGTLGRPEFVGSEIASDYTLPIFSAENINVAQVLWSADPYEMQTWTGGTRGSKSIGDITRPTIMWTRGYDVARPKSIACSVDASADVRTAGLTVHAENAAGEDMPVSYKLECIDYEGLDFWAYGNPFSCRASDFSDGMTYYGDSDGAIWSIRPDAGDNLEQWSCRAAYDGRYAYVWSETPDGGSVAGWESELAPVTYKGNGLGLDLFSSTQESTNAPQILGLGPGKYRLTPNVGPVNPGYNDLPIVEFELAMRPETGEIYVVGSELGDGSPADFINTAVSADSWVYVNYVMTSGIILPVTGGSGTVAIIVAGAFLIACGGVVYFMLQKRRRAA